MQPSRFSLLLVLLCAACARQPMRTVGRPVPTPSRGTPRVADAGPLLGSAAVSGDEAVNYILSRGMAIPVAGLTMSRLQDTFDEGRSSGRVHRALDILAPRGTPVIAADSGRVLRVSVNPLGGNTIYATDPLGRVVYYYAHLDRYRDGLEQGETLVRGDTLGYVGTSGNAPKDTPHLHFQVMSMPANGKYWEGEAINPYPLFLLMNNAAQP